MLIKKRLKAFTVIELLISMTLTGILVAFAFTGLNQLQQLFNNYTTQNNFITEVNQLNSALLHIANKATVIEKQDEHTLLFKADSNSTQLIITEKTILLQFKQHTDTFHLDVKKQDFKTLTINNNNTSHIITNFEADVFFKNQKFRVSFQKQYDAESILKTTLDLFPPDELH